MPPTTSAFPNFCSAHHLLRGLLKCRMLSMDVVASPVLHIAADGRTTTETQLRWDVADCRAMQCPLDVQMLAGGANSRTTSHSKAGWSSSATTASGRQRRGAGGGGV